MVERVGDLMAVKGTALVAKRTFRFRNNARSTGRIVAQRKFLEDQVAETAELDMGIWFAGIGLSKKGKMDDTDVLRKICTISNQAHGKAFELLVAVGMPLTRHPPHRSVRAVLPHTAPASGDDGETARWARGGGYAVAGARHRESV
jgi:hypothetical protein